MSVSWGKGEVILASTPLLFTNYGVLDGKNAAYLFRILSQMGGFPIVRTEGYMKETAQVQMSPFRYFLSQPPLRWALYLSMVSILLFMIFAARRKQRAIPVIREPENKSLEFAELIGTLYYQKKDHADLVRKKYLYFAEELRKEIQVDVEEVAEDERSFGRIARKTGMEAGEIAAFIIEPIVQGAGGMRFYHPEYLLRLRKICDELSILLILDEIATGFGRSGKMFACEYAGVEPDIMCLGKALTGGYVSFAATLATDAVADAISEGVPGLFMHGPTFMGNPLACAAANASLDLIQKDGLLGRIRSIEGILREGLSPLVGSKKVADVRVLGAIGVVELKKSVNMRKFQDALAARGVWLRPFGRLLYTMPPYITDDVDLKTIARAMVETVEECAEL